MSKLITCVIPATSMPRAATSVATSVSTTPASKLASARSRWPWDLSPCIATARTLLARQAFDQPVGAALGAHEHERQPALGLAQLGHQSCDLALVGDRHEAVLDVTLALARSARARDGAGWSCRPWRSRPTSPCSVAENSSVWRSRAQSSSRSCSTTGRKPMSSIRSASSSTSSRMRLSDTSRRSIRSSSRPGVATRMWARAGEARLLDDARAAVYGSDRQRARVGDRTQVVDDLDRQLARGRQDERRGARVGVFQALDHRHAERERLARARR